MTISGQGTASTDTAQRGSARVEVAAWAEVVRRWVAHRWMTCARVVCTGMTRIGMTCTGVARTGMARTGMAEAASPGWRR
jgi:hypothetical protein